METLWVISGALVLSIVAAAFKSRRSAQANLGSVSRDWIMRHGAE